MLGVIFVPSPLVYTLNLYPKGRPRLFAKRWLHMVSCLVKIQHKLQPNPRTSAANYYSLQHATPLRWQVVSVAASSCQSESPASLLEPLQALAFAIVKEGKVWLRRLNELIYLEALKSVPDTHFVLSKHQLTSPLTVT